MRHFTLTAGLSLLLTAGGLLAQEARIDFESTGNDFKGWAATLQGDGDKPQYRVASKWDVPFAFSLDSDNPHEGGVSLKWEFSQDVAGQAILRPPPLNCEGKDVIIRFFVRTKDITEEGIFSFDEMSNNGQRGKGHWSAAKIPASDSWTEVKWHGTLDPATASVRISLIFKNVHAGACVWVDDISVENAPAP